MTGDKHLKTGQGQFTGTRAPGADLRPGARTCEDDFPGDFASLKATVIRPTFERVGIVLRGRGYDVNISEDAHGKLSMHMVPPGVDKSIQAYDWFPTLSYFGEPNTKTVGVQGRNARRNSEGSTGARGSYKPSQITLEAAEKELMKFVGEIANW